MEASPVGQRQGLWEKKNINQPDRTHGGRFQQKQSLDDSPTTVKKLSCRDYLTNKTLNSIHCC